MRGIHDALFVCLFVGPILQGIILSMVEKLVLIH